MNRVDPDGHGQDYLDDSLLENIYGEDSPPEDLVASRKRVDFKAWHHPAKQFVRENQWLMQVERLGPFEGKTIVYLSLPGEDMFDVRVIGEAVKRGGGQIKLLGFNSRIAGAEDAGSQINSESVLRQEGIITDDSLTLPDRLQDIAAPRSHVYERMASYGKFDVVNLDLCDHLGASTDGVSIFDVIEKIAFHQRGYTTPWLFMLTTRVHPNFINLAQEKFSPPIRKNIELGEAFSEKLAELIGAHSCVVDDVDQYWELVGDPLLKIFAVGLGKYLLHLLHNQVQDPAAVELSSCCGYRVEAQHLDMLSVVFRVTPRDKVMIPAAQTNSIEIPEVELSSAIQIVRKAGRTIDVDAALQSPETLRNLVESTERLLQGGNYDVSKYQEWLGAHNVRPHVL
ncbi:hypothetical protein [uncultured Stenotrophomonas sp.]|uniref:PP_RS20740 family protein n=1 Tax=uncultured Stenotrophomonas sp. TaxID=165438 RepID=UPI0025D259DE|nr:hypothetical protein [uncultured Stenotrophomonas sp.]